MDSQRVDDALKAVKQRVAHDQAAADLAAAKAAEARQAAKQREAMYKIALDGLRRQALGKPPRPMPQDTEQLQQYLLHMERMGRER